MAVDIGIFIPIGNNGWLISKTSPQYKPSFELNKRITQRAEHYGFDFALSMIKLRGFGGESEFWDHNLESFTLMSALAAVTTKIKLFASTAILTLPPALVARMASTIDSVAPGRFGINIVTGWQQAEYTQMGMWPGNAYFGYRYEYATEYVQVMKDLWETGVSDLKGEHFIMDDCKLSPRPSGPIKIVAACQSGKGMEFASKYADYNFVMGQGINNPLAATESNARLVEAVRVSGRDVGAYCLFMVIADETDEAAQAKWTLYKVGIDLDATAWIADQGGKDTKADGNSTAKSIAASNGESSPVNMNMGTLVGSYTKVASLLDEAATVTGTKGIMLVFDDFEEGIENFGQKIQPLMKSRSHVNVPVKSSGHAKQANGSSKKRKI